MAKKGSRSKGSRHSRFGKVAEALAGWTRIFIERAWQRIEDLGALFLGAMTFLTVLGLLDLTEGEITGPWITILERWLGWGAWVVPIALLYGVVILVRLRLGRDSKIRWFRIITTELMVICLLAIFALMDDLSLPHAEAGKAGGLVGWGIAILVSDLLGNLGAWVIFIGLGSVTAIYSFQSLIRELWMRRKRYQAARTRVEDRRSPESPAPRQPVKVKKPAAPRSERIPKKFRKHFELPETPDEKAFDPQARDMRLPPFDLLDAGTYSRVSAKEINLAAGLIEKTLADFGLPVRVVDFRTGPSVTQFAVEPGYIEQKSGNGERKQKVRVSQISALANDLALALSAPRVRIEAPVPGRTYVGIEVPNQQSSLVRLRPILESEAFQSIESPLAIALGRDVAGNAVAADLITMPHLLIAGTTGSGKSVCITALATCLIMNNHPDDLKLVMIDPKMVELVRFNGTPHLLGKVETELERITGVLRWCTREMDRRYRLLEKAKARNIEAYNRRRRRRRSPAQLPRLIIMIDELADLMMMAPDQTERTLVRLAQMARATGIHLVMATQRPSTDVVTGLIKANFPARISFAVASGVDSRVILDTPGAETLLGKGDMLFLPPESAAPKRLQGAFVSDLEIERLVSHWREAESIKNGDEPASPPWEESLKREAVINDHDSIIEEAIQVVREEGEASASLLQRRLRIGYPRAARLMDELEELGVVGRARTGGRTREVLIGKDDDPLLDFAEEETNSPPS